jgi:hypothetical protein
MVDMGRNIKGATGNRGWRLLFGYREDAGGQSFVARRTGFAAKAGFRIPRGV